MDKYLPIFEAFVGFLKTLLGNVLKDKIDDEGYADYEKSIKAIFDAPSSAAGRVCKKPRREKPGSQRGLSH